MTDLAKAEPHEFQMGDHVIHRTVTTGRRGRIVGMEPGKVSVQWGRTGKRKYSAEMFREMFVLAPKPISRGLLEGDHLVFKWNHNDAGYRGICSKKIIDDNRRNPRIWCSESGCWKLKAGNSDPRYDEPSRGWPCDESGMFSNYEVSTGGAWRARHEGGGKSLVIDQAHQTLLRNRGRLAFMTTREPGMPESQRYVFGLYEIGDVKNAAEFTDKRKITTRVTGVKEKSVRFHRGVIAPFWGIYHNRKGGPRWCQGLFHYVKTDQAVQYLDLAIRGYERLARAPKITHELLILKGHRDRLHDE